jgi:hypothetical protein
MTLQNARARLTVAVEELWDAVGELVLITVEDQPGQGSLAAADAFAEQVSELQGGVAEARQALSEADELGLWLPRAADAIAAATWRYWQEIRAHRPVMQLRAATRRLGGPWPSWQLTAEQSAQRCEGPLASVVDAARACWVETIPTPAPSLHSVPAGPGDIGNLQRRTS